MTDAVLTMLDRSISDVPAAVCEPDPPLARPGFSTAPAPPFGPATIAGGGTILCTAPGFLDTERDVIGSDLPGRCHGNSRTRGAGTSPRRCESSRAWRAS